MNNKQKEKDTKKGKGKPEENSVYNTVINSLKKAWDFINHRQFWYGLTFFGGFLAFKHFFFERILPITEIQDKIAKSQFSEVLLGNMMMLCYFKNPVPGQWKYCISSMSPRQPHEIFDQIVNQSPGTRVGSVSPNEMHIAQMMGAGASILMAYLMVKTIKDQNSFNSKKKKDLDKKQVGKTFMDVGGCEQAKEAIREIIDFIRNPEQFQKMGVRMPKGLLLYGPPGTGKTLIAKAAATEAKIPVIYVSGSEFVELYVGLGAKRVRDLFAQARSYNAPVMIFIDEIDAVGFKRGGAHGIGSGNRETETTLNQLLNEMDGFEENDKILIVAATNLLENLDPAVQRPGRFDRKIEIKLPDAKDRSNILKIHLGSKNHNLKDLDISKAATFLDGCSGADIENLVNLVALQTVRQARIQNNMEPMITAEDLERAVESFNNERRATLDRANQNQAQNVTLRRLLQGRGGQNFST